MTRAFSAIHYASLGLLCMVVWLCLTALPLRAQSAPLQLWYIDFRNQAELQQLVTEVDVWEVDHAQQRLLAPLTPDAADALRQSYTLTLADDQTPLVPPARTANQPTGIPGYACYRTVDETFATYEQLIADYPHLVRAVDIGDSWDKNRAGGAAGDDIRVLVLTNRAIAGPKFRFMLMGAIHAREYVTAELALRFAESLLEAYGKDAVATYLLDNGELHLLTLANPDGRRFAEQGLSWRKNTNTDAACGITAPPFTYGVDLNRNSSFKWNKCDGFNCSSADSCNQVYRGAAPASEPEVYAIESYLRSIFADQRLPALDAAAPATTPGLFLSLHSYGELVLFPWGYTTTHAPNAAGLATVARRLGYPLNYTVCQAGGAGCLYQTDGTTDDFAYGDLGVASFTIELGTNFFQACSDFENSIAPAGLDALHYAFMAAPQPYQLALGPEVRELHIDRFGMESPLAATTHVTITATADATRLALLSGDTVASITEPVDPIRGARLSVDRLPWANATMHYPMTAVDGAFDSAIENLSTTLETACLPSGRHSLFLQAEDVAGDWGVVAAHFVTVTNSSPFTLTAAPDARTVRAGDTATYTVHITSTAATTTTFTAEYDATVPVTLSPAAPFTLAPGAAQQLTVAITPQKSTTGSVTSVVLKVRQVGNANQCRQLQINTQVATWPYEQRLIYILKH